jgi:tetratricopeptide (TPR) repeat protein
MVRAIEVGLRSPKLASRRLSTARALSQFKRIQRPGPPMVDVEATVEATADARRLVVVTTPGHERGLDVALVVDSSLVMRIYDRELAEFEALLRRAGGFRAVTRWTLVPDSVSHRTPVGEAPDLGFEVMIRDNAGVEHHPDRLLDPTGRRLVLLATDAVADHWYRPGVWQTIERWARVMPTAVLDMLPEQYRAQTALGMSAAVMRSRRPAGPNAVADIQVAWWEADPQSDDGLRAAVPLPVVALRPQALEVWAEAVVAVGTAWADAVWARQPLGPRPDVANAQLTAEDRVQAFQARASREAQALAQILAMARVLTLPLIRVLQKELLPGTGSSELAEVLIGGLIERVPGSTTPGGPEQFRFRPTVREMLLRGMTVTTEWDTYRVITEYLRQDARTGGDIRALLADPQGTGEVNIELAPFAALGDEVASRLGLEIGDGDKPGGRDGPTPDEPKDPARDGDQGERHWAVYLGGLPPSLAERLARVNRPGLAALEGYLASGQAVALLGAGVSAPLYPLWDGLIELLVEAASAQLDEQEAVTLRVLAGQRPEAVVEIVRQQLGHAQYLNVLREVLRMRTDPETGRSWTDVQELVCRCGFKAVVTTNYDPGIVNARMRVRPGASVTGFTTWQDELSLDRWRTGDVFGEDELPVLFAHGQHNRPDTVVLATTEYRRAYQGKLSRVLGQLMDADHLVWIGFSFADQRIAAVLREIAQTSGTRVSPGAAPRHVAIVPWDPAGEGNDPEVLARLAEIEYGAQVVLYPAPDGDHSALSPLLSDLTNTRFPPVGDLPPTRATPQNGASGAGVVMRWVPAAEPVQHFAGRAEELAQLDRWAADPQVALIGVTAWGGAGKTALVTQWVGEGGGITRRPGLRGMFGWSFYADPSAEHWAGGLLEWARRDLGIEVAGTGRVAEAVLALLRTVPLLLVLDGLERVQEGPAGGEFGRLLDGTLREVLAGACQLPHGGLVVLTSRFPLADLETFDGGSARMLEVPPFTAAEGSALLAAAGGGWLAEQERRELVRAVDGHALATGVLAGLLAARLPSSDLAVLHADVAAAARTDARVGKVLEFYAARLGEADRYLLAAVSLFARPVSAEAVLAVAGHEAFGGRLAGWTPAMVRAAVRERLAGLATWHPDGTISAHPLVRDAFRPLALRAAATAADTALTGLPEGTVTSRADALRVTEAIELLLDADQWRPADNLYQTRCNNGDVWLNLPAARLGQRTATAFVATPARRDAGATHLTADRLSFYLNQVGLYAINAGDLATARDYLAMAVRHFRDAGDIRDLAFGLLNLAQCLGRLGQVGTAREAAAEALTGAETAGHQDGMRNSHAYLGWLAGLAGDTTAAEEHFTTADQICLTDQSEHLYSLAGTLWAGWLARTGRPGPAQDLIRRNADLSRENGWNDDLARCDQVLGGLALAAGDTAAAGRHLAAAVAAFRDADYLTDLAEALPGLAAYAQATGDLDTAQRHLAEAISIAAPRSIIPAFATALSARARLRAAQATATGNTDALAQGRDDAEAARRLAIRHRLPWYELDALIAHAALDEAEGTDHDWAPQAAQLRGQLVPPDLDPNPLATVERVARR